MDRQGVTVPATAINAHRRIVRPGEKRSLAMHSRSLPDLLGIDLGPPTRNTARPQNFPKGNRSRSTESASRQPTETKGRLHPIIRGYNVSIADAGRPHSEERKTAIAQHSTKTSPLPASEPPNGRESGRRTARNVHTGGLLIEGQRTCVPAGNNGSRCELDGRRSGGTASCGEQLDTVSAAEAALPPDDRPSKATDLRVTERPRHDLRSHDYHSWPVGVVYRCLASPPLIRYDTSFLCLVFP
jgi:hypothetical protein